MDLSNMKPFSSDSSNGSVASKIFGEGRKQSHLPKFEGADQTSEELEKIYNILDVGFSALGEQKSKRTLKPARTGIEERHKKL